VFCCGLWVVSVDGSTSDVPDSGANDEHFGRPSNQTRHGTFPQVRRLAARSTGCPSPMSVLWCPMTTGLGHFPSFDYQVNAAWLTASMTACILLAWLKLLALDGDLATAEPKTLRYPVQKWTVPCALRT
jgi:hypothetical protein